MSLSVAFRHAWPGIGFDIAFMAPTPGTIALFGPSGCGKSTTANVIAGLLRPAACRVVLDGAVLADSAQGIHVPPERRRIGVVFQDARLFPHLSVERNLRYGLRRAPPGPFGLAAIAELLGIGPLLARRPHTLSGGERQRVAIGRALLSQPRLLVMDEPLASLDAARKAEILPYLARLKATLRLPIVYVTHSLDEVGRLADTLVMIEAGRVRAAGDLPAMASRSDLPIARAADAAAVLPARVAGQEPERGLTRLEVAGQALRVSAIAAEAGASVRLRIPAREVVLATARPEAVSITNCLHGAVRAIAAEGETEALVEIALGPGAQQQALLARVTADALRRLDLPPGKPVFALVKSVSVEVLG